MQHCHLQPHPGFTNKNLVTHIFKWSNEDWGEQWRNTPATLTGVYSPSYSRKKQGVIFDFLIKLSLKPSWPPAGERERKGEKKRNQTEKEKVIKEAFLALKLDSCFLAFRHMFPNKRQPFMTRWNHREQDSLFPSPKLPLKHSTNQPPSEHLVLTTGGNVTSIAMALPGNQHLPTTEE